MQKRKWFKKAVSGMLTAVTLLTSVIAPLPAVAAEISPEEKLAAYVSTLPQMDGVAEQLDAREMISAEAYEVEFGADVNLKTDFTGIIYDKNKVKVNFYKAVNEEGQDFSTSHADTYKATYYAEPVSGNPAYRFYRSVIVKEPVVEEKQTEKDGGSNDGQAGTESESEDAEADADSSEETMHETVAMLESESIAESLPEATIEEAETAGLQDSEKTASETEGSEAGSMAEAESETEESEVTGAEPTEEVLSESELDAALKAAEGQETYDWESGLTVSGVLSWATKEEGIDLAGMESGSSVSFQMPKMKAARAAAKTQTVDITKGTACYYSDYGLGSYLTYPYTVSFGDVKATAYCVQPSRGAPGDGKFTITKLKDSKALAKVCYYGTKASGDEGFFAEKHPDFSAGKRFVITHIAAAYANGSSDAFSGTNDTGKKLAMELYNYCQDMPDIPDVGMQFSDEDVVAYKDGNSQRTKEITFKADELQSITMKLPNGVIFHNVTTGKNSKAGADVEVTGGTKFYLSAPLTQVNDAGASWSATMKGSVTKDYSAYKITTGSDTQDLALVFGEAIGAEKYVDFKVTWLALANINITKTDSVSGKNLSGAVFGVYSDKSCTNLITKMPATDKNGFSTVEIVVTQDTVYLKEITAPKGYVYSVTARGVKVVAGKDSSLTVPNKEIMGSISVHKEGEVLTGAKTFDNGVTFQYEKKRLEGASYKVTAGADIVAADGTLVYQKGAVVSEKLTTNKDGTVTLNNLHLGTYVVTETGAPKNYINKGESKKITLTEIDPTQEVVLGEVTFVNDRQKVSTVISKVDDMTKNPLSGGIYGLYAGEAIKNVNGDVIVAKDVLIQRATTGADGKAAFAADLPLNVSYYVKELQAPKKYVRNETDVFTFTANYTQETEAVIEFTYTFKNERVNARIDLMKVDAETGAKTQGDASLEGAAYGLYAREDIVHPDGKTGVVYKKDFQIATLTTDQSGKAFIENLYLGKYYIKELVASEGYLLDIKEYDLDCADEGDLVKTVKKTVTSKEQVIKQPFQVIKAANNGKTDADLLSGVGFTAYLISSLKVNADGSYDFAKAEPVVIAEDGKTEMFTDGRGHAQSIALPYGRYIVRETTAPHNFTPVDDFIVTITENHPTTPQVWRVLLDDEFEAKLKIVKKDDETKKSILLPYTEFKVYDMDHDEYVEQVTTYPETTVHKSYFTDANGYLTLPNNLHPGHYRIEEVNAPEGYTLNANSVEVLVDSNTAYQLDSVSGDAIITVEVENHPVKGKLTIIKQGEILKGHDKDFSYEEQNLAGAEFTVYAAEDIYTPDHQKDADGNRVVIFAQDAPVASAVTNDKGEAIVSDLPLGAYYVKEVKAPYGFVLNTQPQAVKFAYLDQDTPVIEQSVTFENERQKVSISVEKQDAENGNKIAGATFGLYAKEAIMAGDEVLVKAGTLLEEAVSGEDGSAVFTLDLPLGLYYVKETKAPAGFVSSDEVLEYDASYQGQDVPVVKLSAVKKNEPTIFEFTKSDVTTGVELDGAALTVMDKKGDVIDTWTSVKGEPHVIRHLTAGESYVLREEFAPYGYIKATDVSFTVEDTAEVQKVEMKDEVPTALLIVNKKGEFLDKVSLIDNAKGVVEHLFEYITGNLTKVTFEVYAAEDIHAADGMSDDYFKKDDLVGTITTDDKGIAKLGDLPLGKYYVKEVGTAYGYVLDDEPRVVDLSYRDQDTPVVVCDENWQNNRQTVAVRVLKVGKETKEPLQGGIFGLFTSEDIKSATGKTLIEKDTIIELKTTDAQGQVSFTADLPVDGKYYVQEQYAPAGYVTTNEKKEFTFSYDGADQEEVVYDFTFENEPTTYEFSKTDITTGEEIPGAHLEVRDADGNLVDEWVSEKKPHMIRKLEVGKEYSMIETKPADGYVTAETIAFTIENTSKIVPVEMKDDVTKVEISKMDITSRKELPGAKLTILDKDGKVVESWVSEEKPHYIERLSIGDYTLREETAPDGYLKAEDVKFSVKDIAEIQRVEMKDTPDTPGTPDTPQETPGKPDTPKTGDESRPLLWAGLAALALFGLIGSLIAMRKNKKYR
ncbi:MAG: SpaA isopeptide-forming pilin-related protein [Porcincola intestinalis]|uniref:LPXTG cell wall anchor domain-containing protein n=2 Tax=Porcincola intestinalis TaxID=2606632 RepID=A0A6L5X3B6_9FIRM|nr:SpaA isopeptide-forming pilin-related protein [Porcincola intestinalis]MCI6767635.1 LPXTG cell wall anchor domain-containing protein [Lachnospiraceae bacterium]MDD7060505.1 SpaA isopeptide-forming pilin-related protein [Porcincola intestinalis]MDY5282526.1 SpaA isopeptide-forming pilin-related protein [Porcincola intestinalis]MSS13838.1 LPXTG cell wall anchor domain-containing protein [Porcincola intestinalis]